MSFHTSMISVKKIVLLSVASIVLFAASPVLAQTQAAAAAATSTPMVLIATVNIYNATTTAQQGAALDISFDIGNTRGVQTGVKYGVALVRGSNVNETVVDEYTYDDELTLGENSLVHKAIVYTAPAYLSGTYKVELIAESSSGFPFGTASIGTATFRGTATGTVSIPQSSCFLVVAGSSHKYPIGGLVALSASSKLSADCTVSNNTSQTMTLIPSFVTRKYGPYGDVVSSGDSAAASITLKPKESKDFIFPVPLVQTQQIYNVAFSLHDAAGVTTSNKVLFGYSMIVSGPGATLESLTLDKDHYLAGDTAHVSVLLNVSSGVASSSLIVGIAGQGGISCIAPLVYALSPGNSFATIPVGVIRDCSNPIIQASIVNGAHDVLDSKEFAIVSSQSVVNGGAETGSRVLWILVGALLIVIAGAAAYFRFKDKTV